MIKFFRRIRQRLVVENRFSKYLLYAIGEIILVVIGILIALQINNWNTQKLENEELQGYLNNIAKNIQSDQENLKDLIKFRDSSRLGAREIMRMVNDNDITKENVQAYFKHYGNYLAFFDTTFRAALRGFEALKNSGYIGKLQNTEIETLLFQYYEGVAIIANEESRLNTFIEEMESEMFKRNGVQQLRVLMRRKFSEPEDVQTIKDLFNYPPFTGANLRVSNMSILFNEYNKLLEMSELILSEITEQYSKA